jgi:hypothetical protein
MTEEKTSMGKRRSALLIVAAAVALLFAASSANADRFSMTGKYGSRRGALVNIPLFGATFCPGHVEKMNAVTAATTGALPIITTPATAGWIPGATGINPGGCVPAAVTAASISDPAGASVFGGPVKSFTIPVNAFKQPLPGALNVVPVPITAVQQLATSWGVSGPVPVTVISGGADARTNASFFTTDGMGGNNLAPWRQFSPSAWMGQTGRAGPNFTVCWGRGNPISLGGPFGPCANIGNATKPLLSKYTAGVSKFGGTMTLLLKVGANSGSVAVVTASGIPPGGVLIQPLAGSGTALGGRGYLATRQGAPDTAKVYLMFMTASGGGGGNVITAVSTLLASPMIPANTAMPLPFTTGTVVARKTGLAAGGGAVTVNTHSAMGTDTRNIAGSGNITMVSGGISVSPGATTSAIDMVSLNFVPEPGSALMLVAGSLGLIGLNRVKRRRS